MKIRQAGSNQTVLELDNGNEVFFSYETPVAAFISGKGYICTDTYYSRTTSKHIGMYLRDKGSKIARQVVPQAELSAMVQS